MRNISAIVVLFLTALLSLLPSTIEGAALTTSVDPHSRSCFYAWVDKSGEKVGFYFAVQSGGSFDIEYAILDPNEKVVVSGVKERQADLVFTGNTVGEYSFCFENSMSSFAVKIVCIMVRSDTFKFLISTSLTFLFIFSSFTSLDRFWYHCRIRTSTDTSGFSGRSSFRTFCSIGRIDLKSGFSINPNHTNATIFSYMGK